jgi:hypothetical protein
MEELAVPKSSKKKNLFFPEIWQKFGDPKQYTCIGFKSMKVSLSCERTKIQETFHQEAVSHIYETDNEQCSYDIYTS